MENIYKKNQLDIKNITLKIKLIRRSWLPARLALYLTRKQMKQKEHCLKSRTKKSLKTARA